jgi:radical SAM protein with 4Fe4S-binding SPASM domain
MEKQEMTRTITLSHDAIDYTWHDVPEKKYRNWKKMCESARDIEGFAAPGYPYMLQIEPTNHCNLACTVCPSGRNELNRDRRHMNLDEFRSIIDDMQDYLLFLVMWDWGEPLLNPELPAMIRYANKQGIKTVTSTNGHLPNDESFLKDLLTSGLSTIIVAIDSLSSDHYEEYRKKGSLNRALEGLKKIIAVKKRTNSKTEIVLRMVVMKQNEHEMASMRKNAELLGVDRFTVKTANPTCGTSCMDETIVPDNPEYRRYEYFRGTYERIRSDAGCSYIWFMSNIQSNGDVVPCTCDYDGEMKVGNIRTQKFSEIWDSPAYRELRRRVFYKSEVMGKCGYCDCNFSLSSSGWFVESVNFHSRHPFWDKVLACGKRYFIKAIRMGRRGLSTAAAGPFRHRPGQNRRD